MHAHSFRQFIPPKVPFAVEEAGAQEFHATGSPPVDLVGMPSHITCLQAPAHVLGMPHPPSSPCQALMPSKSKSVSSISTLTSFCPGSCEKGLAVCLIFKAIMDECTHTSYSTAIWEVLFGGICSTDYWKVCPTRSQLGQEEVSGESCLHLIHRAHLGFDHCRFFTALIFLPKCDGPLVLLS